MTVAIRPSLFTPLGLSQWLVGCCTTRSIGNLGYLPHRACPGGSLAVALPEALGISVVRKPINHRGRPGGVKFNKQLPASACARLQRLEVLEAEQGEHDHQELVAVAVLSKLERAPTDHADADDD